MPGSRMLNVSPVVGVVVGAVAAAAALTGCAPPSLHTEARTLLEAVRSSAGVETATLDYAEPMTLDSGKLDIRVEMSPRAGTAEVAEVVATVYDAYATTHVHEEGDLSVRWGDDRVHLRTFEPVADRAAVRTQTTAALRAADRGRLEVGVLADDVPADPGVRTAVVLRLPPGSTGAAVLPTFAELEATADDLADLGWTVRAADGSGLAAEEVSPSPRTLRRWRQLGSVEVPGAEYAVDYVAHRDRKGRVYPRVRVTVRGTEAPLSLEDPTDHRRLMRLARAQVEHLQSYSAGVSYALILEGRRVASVDDVLAPSGRGPGTRFAEQLARTTGLAT
ncbi:hypothetical protein [Nocardioides donggukensis]|uniref:Uncharacterized protein n=1 Tax=Nocardioides donggukensis TaxID=2774019 RepID=A0A927Q3Z3_9ACTN|nr:hypothetical protein [Nocardioides donggukensis]MBD8871036.1 hypothetical protein [Nocardioides donggukensis]